MKKIIILLLLLSSCSFALDYSSYCPAVNNSKTASGVIMSTTGVNFLARTIAQNEIERALKKETNSKFNVKIDSFWGSNIINGEFSKFRAVSKNYSHKDFCAEELIVETICPYSKVSYKNDKLNFDTDMILKYTAELNQNNLSQMLKHQVQIIGNKIAFDYKISVFGVKTKINLKAGLSVVDNKIQLNNVEFNNKTLNVSKYIDILNGLKLTEFDVDIDKSTSANVKVDDVKIKNSKAYITGYVLIPKS